jgi:hypothetical protein
MRSLISRLFFVTALGLVATAATAAVPNAVTVTYDGFLNGLQIVVMREKFTNDGGRYHLVSDSTAVGLFKLLQPKPARFVSSGLVTEKGLQPETFAASRGTDDPRRVSATFDWAQERLAISHDGKNESFELPPGTQDRLSVMYQFMFGRYDDMRYLEFHMTNGRKLDSYRYAITQDVEVDTPLGRFSTLHLVKQRAPDETGTEIWIAPQLDNIPVRMVVIENGRRYEQMITGLERKP